MLMTIASWLPRLSNYKASCLPTQENVLLLLQTAQLAVETQKLVVETQKQSDSFLSFSLFFSWLAAAKSCLISTIRLRLCIFCAALLPADCPWYSAAHLGWHLKHT